MARTAVDVSVPAITVRPGATPYRYCTVQQDSRGALLIPTSRVIAVVPVRRTCSASCTRFAYRTRDLGHRTGDLLSVEQPRSLLSFSAECAETRLSYWHWTGTDIRSADGDPATVTSYGRSDDLTGSGTGVPLFDDGLTRCYFALLRVHLSSTRSRQGDPPRSIPTAARRFRKGSMLRMVRSYARQGSSKLSRMLHDQAVITISSPVTDLSTFDIYLLLSALQSLVEY